MVIIICSVLLRRELRLAMVITPNLMVRYVFLFNNQVAYSPNIHWLLADVHKHAFVLVGIAILNGLGRHIQNRLFMAEPE
jgi:hypothetical protein